MRSAAAFLLLVALAPLAASQDALLPLPINVSAPTLPVPLPTPEVPALPATGVAVPNLPALPVALPLTLDPGIVTKVISTASPSAGRSPSVAGPDGFPAEPLRNATTGTGPAPRGDAPPQLDPPQGGMPPEDPPPASLETLAVAPPTPIDPSPTTSAVALGATAALLIAARLYSRFGPRDVLDSGPRAKLRALLDEHPGATLPELKAWTGWSRGALIHHAQMLERHGVIVSRHDGLNRRLYPTGRRVDVPLRPLTPAERRVLDALRDGPLTQAELSARLGVTVQAVSYHLGKLRREEEVRADGEQGAQRWMVARE